MAENTIWPLDDHTAAKHVILRKYLSAWLPKLTRYNGRVLICDGFAGPGIYSKGEEGSPVIALRTFLDHSYREKMSAEVKYVFIESDKERYESLCQVIEEIGAPGDVGVTILHDEYEQAFGKILDYLDEADSRLAPTFAFIDPFGVSGVPLEIIDRLMAHGSCEVLITFMVSYIHRFLSRPEFEPHCDRLFGCEDWRAANELRGQDRESFLRGLYQRQLENSDIGVGAEYVRFFTMKDARNRTIYDLFFATNHRSGIDAMKDAMWQVDQTGAYSFSDATDPDQETLFSNDPEWDQLFDFLLTKFGGHFVAWPDVEEAVRRTPFRILKRPFQAESKKADARLKIVNSEGTRRGTLNESTVIRFAD
jgi:three-Cys-motif partner protein